MSHHLVEAVNLGYLYPDGTEALKRVSFRIVHGESVAIVGPNGAGKSTLLNHLNGSLLASSGEARVGGIPVRKETLSSVRKAVGMVFQDPDDQLFMPTVIEDVTFGPLNLGLSPEEARLRALEALRQVGCEHLKDRPPYHLSSGEKKAVAIATVLSTLPDVLVLDEPTANLDARHRRRIIDLIRGFHHTRIIATHDLDLVLDVCDRAILLNNGILVADAATAELMRDKILLEQHGLEQPLRMQECPLCGKHLT